MLDRGRNTYWPIGASRPVASVRSRPVLVALVAILAVAVAAGTLNTAVTTVGTGGAGGEGGLGGGQSSAAGPQSSDTDDSGSFSFQAPSGAMPDVPLPCLTFLTDPWFVRGFLLVAAVGLYLLYRRTEAIVPVAVVVAATPPGILLYALLTSCGTRSADPVSVALPPSFANVSSEFSLFGGAGGGGAAAGGRPAVSLALVGLLGLALVAAVAVLVRSTAGDEPAAEAPAEPAPERMAAIGRSAGRAADRIEADADPDNAVYRAWKEMTDRLEVANPAASTPAEFADAAVAAGMDRDDVAELTALFESVRYGTAPPTDDREARAVDALRRIENAYAGEDA